MEPLSAVAVAVIGTDAPTETVAPLAGEVMLTEGGPATVTVNGEDTVAAPLLSYAVAVIVYVPAPGAQLIPNALRVSAYTLGLLADPRKVPSWWKSTRLTMPSGSTASA